MITAFVVKKKYPATAFSWELVLVKSANKIDTHFGIMVAPSARIQGILRTLRVGLQHRHNARWCRQLTYIL
jgi:hypothetical protein